MAVNGLLRTSPVDLQDPPDGGSIFFPSRRREPPQSPPIQLSFDLELEGGMRRARRVFSVDGDESFR